MIRDTVQSFCTIATFVLITGCATHLPEKMDIRSLEEELTRAPKQLKLLYSAYLFFLVQCGGSFDPPEVRELVEAIIARDA